MQPLETAVRKQAQGTTLHPFGSGKITDAELAERRALGLDPYPASTAIQARICRSDLLVAIEAIAMLVRGGKA